MWQCRIGRSLLKSGCLSRRLHSCIWVDLAAIFAWLCKCCNALPGIRPRGCNRRCLTTCRGRYLIIGRIEMYTISRAFVTTSIACNRVASAQTGARLCAPPLVHAVRAFEHRALYETAQALRRGNGSISAFWRDTFLSGRHCHASNRWWILVLNGRV